ncbi:autotransporter-associated beta strand repeat-containing protein [Verrucomicrobium sp. BvORR034]|uniref:beta strand repeat-containing protein n=1 Tax=Verrucomicrobium sp. BvORR034 TaxID=1396418 RepID=UPI0006798267|nr:autotransporter-associated beta strand repeat-containing protein [Verrucomicrobium sp. BvORR034]
MSHHEPLTVPKSHHCPRHAFRKRPWRFQILAWIGISWLTSTALVPGASYTYDDDGDTANGITDGSSAGWNTTAGNAVWFDGNGNLVWPNTDTSIAIFGGGTSGVAGSVAVGTVIANGIVFNATASGTYTLAGGSIAMSGSNPTITTNVDAVISSVISGSSITKAGAGKLTLSGTNTFTSLTVTGGLVEFTTEGSAAGGQLGKVPTSAAAGVGNITLNGGGISFASGIQIQLSANRGIAIGNNGGTILNNTAATNFVNGAITNVAGEVGTLTINGSGTLAFSNNSSTYSGGTVISGGVVVVPTVSSVLTGGVITSGPFGTGTITFNGGQMRPTSGGSITLHNAIVFNANTIFASGGGSNALTFAGTVLLTGTRTITNSSAGAVIFTNTISDGGLGYGFTKSGSGTVTFSGANTYSGTTSVTAGTLSAGAVNAFSASSAVTLTNVAGAILNLAGFNQTIASLSGGGALGGNVTLGSATLATGGNNTSTIYAGIISGTGGLTKVGTGTMTLAAANTYTGPTVVQGGGLTLNFSASTAPVSNIIAATSALTLNAASLTLTGKASTANTQTFNGLSLTEGSSTITLTANATANPLLLTLGSITRSATATVNFALPAGTQDATNGVLTTSTNTNRILGGWATVNGTDYATVNASGNIVAYTPDALVDRLGGVISSLAGSNVKIVDGGASGNITLTGGVSGVFDINTLAQSATGGTATIAPGTTDILRFGASGGILLASGASSLVIGTTAGDGRLTAGGATNAAGELIISNFNAASGSSITINSLIIDNGTGAVSLIKTGTGTLILNGTSNTYSGKTYIQGGILTAAADGSLGLLPGSTQADNITLNGGTLRWGAAFTLNAARGVTLGAAGGTLDTQAFNTTYSGVIAGSGPLTKSGTGALTLTGNNTYTGITTVSANALLVVGSNTALGSNTAGTVVAASGVNSGILRLQNGVTVTGESLSIGGTSQVAGGAQSNRGSLQVEAGATGTWTGNILLTDHARVGTQDNGILIISGVIDDGASTYRLQISGDADFAHRLTSYTMLSGANTYNGTTELIRGTLKLGATNTLTTTTVLDVHQANSNTTDYAGLDMNGFDQTIGTLQSTGVTSIATASDKARIFNSSTTQSTLTVNQASNTDYLGMIEGNIALVKAGAGILTLSSTGSSSAYQNSYTGATTVSGGTLQVGKSGIGTTGTGAVTVNGAGSVLAGTGTIRGAATVILGTIRPGDNGGTSAGTLNFAQGLTFAPTSSSTVAVLNVDSTGVADKIQVTGSLTFSSNSKIELSFDGGYNPTVGSTWSLIDWSGLLTLNGFTNGSNLILPDLTAYNPDWYYEISNLVDGATGGSLVVTIAPEPTSTALLALGLSALVLRRRRKKA